MSHRKFEFDVLSVQSFPGKRGALEPYCPARCLRKTPCEMLGIALGSRLRKKNEIKTPVCAESKGSIGLGITRRLENLSGGRLNQLH